MKKVSFIIVLFLSFFMLTSCTSNETKKSDKPVNLKEITGDVVKAKLDKDGNILINKKDISYDATYISYDYEGVTIGLLAVKDSKGEMIVVVNTCQSCGGSPYAYFVQVGNQVQCQNCGNMFDIDGLHTLEPDGCNPIGIEERKDTEDTITISVKQLQKLKNKFINWEGPKA